MFAEVVAVPTRAPEPMRVGARFNLSEATPLRIGRSSQCRLTVDTPTGKDVWVGLQHGQPTVWAEAGQPIECSLNGRALEPGLTFSLADGDHLRFAKGLVLAVRERPLVVTRHLGLEAALAEAPDDVETRSVYADLLTEQGDTLALWLANERRHVEAEQWKVLGPLADSARSLAVRPTFASSGLLSSVTVARPGVIGPPGLFWHLEQLGTLAVARSLRALSLHVVEGAVARAVEAPRGTSWNAPSLETIVRATLEVLSTCCFAGTLEWLSFGTSADAVGLPASLEPLIAQALPRWKPGPLVHHAVRASLEVLELPTQLSVFGIMPGQRLRLTAETRFGADERSHVLLRGPMAPGLACRVVRRAEGFVVISDEARHAGVRLNGALVQGATLAPGDELEPVPGFRLRYRSET